MGMVWYGLESVNYSACLHGDFQGLIQLFYMYYG